jgi:hypothetical protein
MHENPNSRVSEIFKSEIDLAENDKALVKKPRVEN